MVPGNTKQDELQDSVPEVPGVSGKGDYLLLLLMPDFKGIVDKI